MSKITVAANVAEIAAPAPQTKAKPAANAGEFKGMLSDAVKSGGSKQDAAPKADNKLKAGQSRTKPEKTVEEKANPEPARKPGTDSKETDAQTAGEMVAATAATITAEPDKSGESESLTAPKPVSLQGLRIRPVKTAEAWKAETAQAMETQTLQTEEVIQPEAKTETNPVQVATEQSQAETNPATGTESQQAGTNPVQTEIKPWQTGTNPVQAGTNQTQAGTNNVQAGAKQPQAEKESAQAAHPAHNHDGGADSKRVEATERRQAPTQHEAVQANQANPVVRVNPQADTITATMEKDIESAEVITQPSGIWEQVPVQARPAKMTPEQMEQAQTRFEEMLAKASQKLEQSKAPVVEEAVDITETPVQVQTEQEDPVNAAEETKTTVETAPAQEAEPKQEQRAHIRPEARDTAARFEQKQEKVISKTDEAVLGMVQPAKPETNIPDTVRTETQTYANPVKVPEQAEQIRTQVIRNLEDGKMEFRMRLNPRELGSIDVKLVLESGKMAVEIAAASPASAELLSKQAESLMASLKLGNVDVSYVNVVEASANASGDMNSQYNLNSFQNRSGSQEQGGFNRNGGGNQTSENHHGQSFDEANETPQRLLNYQV